MKFMSYFYSTSVKFAQKTDDEEMMKWGKFASVASGLDRLLPVLLLLNSDGKIIGLNIHSISWWLQFVRDQTFFT